MPSVQFSSASSVSDEAGKRLPRHRTTLPLGPILLRREKGAQHKHRRNGSSQGFNPNQRHGLQKIYSVESASVEASALQPRLTNVAPVASHVPPYYSYIPQGVVYNAATAEHPRTWFPMSHGTWSVINGIPVWTPSPHPSQPAPPQVNAAPAVNDYFSSYSFPPVPAVCASDRFHSDLFLNPMKWSLNRPPSNARSRALNIHSWESLGKWATEPAFPGAAAIAIKWDHISTSIARWQSSWGEIHVQRDASREITVELVLECIYAYFQTPLTDAEYESLPIMERNLVYTSRFRRLSGSKACIEKDPLRLDILQGQLEFAGLRLSYEHENGAVEALLDLGLSYSWISWPSYN